ncbi:ABC transporter substrate-binding protein [Desulfosarcina alkanivorans]|uniref:ABC transporter substrate-binding protein n=1 Tax=Desulfosarcina alkanivorans TaxID=571177 RepID=A0A5K7YKC0_9BACT|nr:iron ABC transporter permease [Desulfosarcina alkanivorans]BBO68610.1 ABC transporter substrate-binding protein [Desulfosarcina alkanivorans]
MRSQPKFVSMICMALFLGIVVLPMVMMFGKSFAVDGSFSVDNYISVFTDGRMIGLFTKSLALSFLATIMALLLGVPFAFLMSRTDVPGKKLWQWLYLLPLCIPSYIHAIAWLSFLGPKGIWPTFIAGAFGLGTATIDIYNLYGSATILALSYFPFVILLALCGFDSMDRRLEEAAGLIHKPVTVFLRVTLPLVSPHIFSGAVLVFLFSLFDYGVPALLRVHVYPVEAVTQFSAFYNEGAATAQSFPVIIVGLILLGLQRRFMGNRSYVTLDTGSRKAVTFELGRAWPIAFLFFGLVITVSVIVPIMVLISRAGFPESYQVVFNNSLSEVTATMGRSLASATVIVLLGYFLSEMIENKPSFCTAGLDYMTLVPLAFPATALGIGLIYCWNRPATEIVYQSSWILISAYVGRFLPFAVRASNANLKQIGGSLKDAALLMEKRWWKRLLSIELPLATPGLVAGWIIAFILCMGELGATLLVIPPGQGSISLKIYTLMHYGANQVVAAMALVLVFVNVSVATGLAFGVRKFRPFRIAAAGQDG